ncbi:2-polyprenylphenol hydroxylase and related flavodoxin oxidoreductases / CDP-6-deoxy-delta-3,4-glucoseen reductase-like protein [Thioalkalivibrio nitratireducens DSM 14787]|uniref:2-polyprenylphenol hydroxylase and related flavodoxin oxidoreductases / CDP-6-deoxy-delta-3,4-glucoseen reductase-like protein n=1 Tax=Thioalkalivibrio nitratireducens (strain DSM 14787 / UNIQEM 213 / ALEN2) TaxID=1255043 RepID=L0E461_THIND|nr:CDP-6-deoxy-delta-3,4-glucoseen reductase [Thioalkalivibrio nitratireducens]AGA35451.1 2-polyprenylphenol hydroxylase and related flavodoxin oxidoreductases / CDP-6-deoxy-delta-3,4-glucoseen reductase-like protein [Thioalkalivibrio nitratireducens DSM 14787]
MAFQVTVRPANHVFTVEDGETVLDAALRQGFAFPYGCRDGACGTCRGRVLSGTVDYGPRRPPGLSDENEAAGFALFCQAVPVDDLEIEVREVGAVRDIAIKTLPCRVASRSFLAPDVVELRLQLPATERLQFLAGQYIDILLKGGERRSYSLANAPHDDRHLVLHVKKVPGGRFSDAVFHEMKEKALLRIEGPLGSFILDEQSERPRLFVGGGTGFAPLKGMLDHLAEQGLDHPLHLFWGARDAQGIYAADWLRERIAQHGDRFRFTPVLSEATDPEVAGFPARSGWLHDAVCATYPDLSDFDVYMAGPPPMIQAAKPCFFAAGLPEDRLFYDSFEPAAQPVPGTDAATV